MAKLVIETPSKKSKGFLKRQYKALLIQERATAGDPQAVKDMVAFLAEFVTSHPRDEAIAHLWEASEEEIDELMAVFTGSAAPLAE